MKAKLWENSRVVVWKAQGRIAQQRIAAVEPEGRNYYVTWAFRLPARQRGTLYGNPALFEYHDTFYGAVHYDRLDLVAPDGESVTIRDLIAVKKFGEALAWGSRCTLYLLSGKGRGETTLVFAARTQDRRIEDLAGVGALVDTMVSSIKRQARLLLIPAALSVLVFGAIGLPLAYSLLGPATLVILAVILLPLAGFFVAGVWFAKKRLYCFPTAGVLADILRREGFDARAEGSAESAQSGPG